MKILCLCSALDLRFRYGCTPAWWQFFKGLYELGHDVIAVPYQGPAIETPWWRVYPNPCQAEGAAFSKVKKLFGAGPTPMDEGFAAQVSRSLIDYWIRPRWEEHLKDILRDESGVDAVIVFSIPLNHFSGLPTTIRDKFGIPFYYYDGDVPASLPRFGGFASGFKIYEGANLREYDAVLCNSEGGAEDLKVLGAQEVEVVHWGVDPELYAPLDADQDRDVFFYGFGAEYREKWLEDMLAAPSRALPDRSFAVGGRGFSLELGNAKRIGDVPFSAFRRESCRSKINLNITREAHATVHASSSMRPFELAAMGACIVTNPVEGIDQWFTPGRDLEIIHSAADAVETYTDLLNDPGRRRAMGESARNRVLENHTHRHRADQIARFLLDRKP